MAEALRVPRGEYFTVKLSMGNNESHEATSEHHIRWIRVYFKPDVGRTVEVATYNLAHAANQNKGASARSLVDTEGNVQCTLAVTTPGTLLIWAYCNRHGFWERSMRLELEYVANMEEAERPQSQPSYFNG